MNKEINVAPARQFAYRVLYDVLINGAYANISVNKNIGGSLKAADRTLAVNIIYGTLKKYNRLLKMISRLADRPYDKLDAPTRIILPMTLYQIFYLAKVPAYAAINDAVNMCRFYRVASAAPFVNAVLRSSLRRREELSADGENFAQRMYYEYNMAPWLTELLVGQYGRDWLAAYAAAAEKSPAVYIRVNTLKTDAAKLTALLAAENISVEPTYVPGSLKITAGGGVFAAKAYRDGLFFAQDLSGAISAYFTELNGEESARAGVRILDMCAAPGAKSFNAAMLSADSPVFACDISENKLDMLYRSAVQLGIKNLRTRRNDASHINEKFRGGFERVICDVPCSGLGVIGRKPEILLRADREKIEKLCLLQEKILLSGLDALKPGGVLVYSTCTVNKCENEEIIKKALASRADVHLAPVKLPFALKAEHPETENGMLCLDPVRDGCDGFFAAKLIKDAQNSASTEKK